jgi:hypothetical protein
MWETTDARRLEVNSNARVQSELNAGWPSPRSTAIAIGYASYESEVNEVNIALDC